MNNLILIIWLIIFVLSLVKRFANRSNEALKTDKAPVKPVTAEPGVPRIKRPVRPLVEENRVRFGVREDLQPGYMYLNGVKVLIKEADRLEFLR